MERWLDCDNFPGYKVSNFGRVKNKFNRILKLRDHKGYLRAQIYDATGKQRNARVHRLVAIAFLENPEDLPNVDHKNRIRSDNRLENLRWVDQVDNCASKISSVGIVNHIIELYNSGMSPEDIYKTI